MPRSVGFAAVEVCNVEGDLDKEFKKMRENWKAQTNACRNKAVTVENSLHRIRLTEAKKEEKFLRDRNADSARLHEVVSALRRVIEARVEMTDKAAHMLTKVR